MVAALTVEREFWARDHRSRQSSLVRAHQTIDIDDLSLQLLSAGGEALPDLATMGLSSVQLNQSTIVATSRKRPSAMQRNARTKFSSQKDGDWTVNHSRSKMLQNSGSICKKLGSE
jgi:hypothetical protein